jgi:membrane-associated protease RseP (regulator of RpoE activity)
VLYALEHPPSFAVLLVGFVAAVTLHGWVQARVAARAGESDPGREGRLSPDPRRHLDPFGAIGAAVSGTGWSRQVELSRRRSTPGVVGIVLSGTLANAGIGLSALVAYRLLGGPVLSGSLVDLQQGLPGRGPGLVWLYLIGLSNLAVAALSLVPLPPLPGGRLLFALAPRTPGWQQARYRLLEQNIGVAVLLVLLLLPLGGPQPILPTVLDAVLNPVLRPLLS